MKEILSRFCCKPEEERPNLVAPWSAGNYSYATNRHIICRVPRLEDIPERDDAPGAGELFQIPDPPEWFPLADMVLPSIEIIEKTCPDCNGAGTEDHECPECDGDGKLEFSNIHSVYEVDCSTCDGEGKVNKCEECNATGRITMQSLQPTPVGNAQFQLRYLHLLSSLPNCKLGPSAKPLGIASFTFDGGDGLLMPMNITALVKP